MPLDPEARSRLALQQEALVAALLAKGEIPANFDSGRLQAAAGSLAQKRRREAALAWPRLAAALGQDFAAKFGAFAREQDPPGEGGPRADGRSFARWLAKRGELPDEGRIEALAADLRHRRRLPALRVAWLPNTRTLVFALHLPGLGERWLRLPLRPRGR